MIEKQSEYLQKLPIEPTVANPVYTNGHTEETKHVEEASSSVCLDDEKSWKCLWTTPNNISPSPLRIFEKFLQKRPVEMCKSESPFYLAVNYNSPMMTFGTKKKKMGKDRINTIMKRMAASAGLSGEKQIIQLEKQWLHVLPRIVYQKHR